MEVFNVRCSSWRHHILGGNSVAKDGEMSYFWKRLCPCLYRSNEWHGGTRSATQKDLLLFLSLKEGVMNCLR